MHERDVVVVAEQGDDLLRLTRAQEAVVDEHAGELLADRLVDQDGRDRGVHAAREPAHHAAIAHPGPDPLDRPGPERGHGPVPRAARYPVREVGEELGAVGRVHDLGVELHPVEAPRVVGHHRERRALGDADDAEAVGQADHPGRRDSSTPGAARRCATGPRSTGSFP